MKVKHVLEDCQYTLSSMELMPYADEIGLLDLRDDKHKDRH